MRGKERELQFFPNKVGASDASGVDPSLGLAELKKERHPTVRNPRVEAANSVGLTQSKLCQPPVAKLPHIVFFDGSTFFSLRILVSTFFTVFLLFFHPVNFRHLFLVKSGGRGRVKMPADSSLH